MSTPKLVLYDLARRSSTNTNTSWSYNVWKTRLALNYKQIPYETFWVDHDTLGPTLKALGVPANTSGSGFEYTVPTVKFPDGTVVTGSAVIAKELEARYPAPTPSLGLDMELQGEAERVVHITAMPLFAVYMPQVAREVVRESTVPTFVASREKRFGVSLEVMEKNKGGEVAWKAAEPGFLALKRLLTERKVDQGPFILGSRVCYADFVAMTLFEAFKRAGGGMFERAVDWDEVFRRFYEAAVVWTENDC